MIDVKSADRRQLDELYAMAAVAMQRHPGRFFLNLVEGDPERGDAEWALMERNAHTNGARRVGRVLREAFWPGDIPGKKDTKRKKRGPWKFGGSAKGEPVLWSVQMGRSKKGMSALVSGFASAEQASAFVVGTVLGAR